MTENSEKHEKTRFTVDDMLALPRLSGLSLSPDGETLVAAVSRESDDGKKMSSALYRLDPKGNEPPRRLTRSKPGESGATFAPDGTLLFTSSRPDTTDDDDDEASPRSALWALSPSGGEAYPVAAPPGGIGSVVTAKGSAGIAFSSGTFPGVKDDEEETEREKARKDAGVGAQLFEGYPIRFWDHFLGPREPHLYVTELSESDRKVEARDLTPEPGRSLDLASFDLTPDGERLVVSRSNSHEDPRDHSLDLVLIETATGEERVLADDEAWYSSPACSPDGRYVAVLYEEISTADRPGDQSLHLFDLETGESRDLLPNLDLWPEGAVWSRDGATVYFTAHCEGHAPVFALDLRSGEVRRLSESGAFSDLCPAPDGETLYALRSTVSEPPHPVALDTREEGQEPRRIRSFEELDALDLPARLERVSAESDGATIPSWLLLPPDASEENPAPLAVFVHGGPLNSWNSWHWRWNPHVFVDAGWAVLLPDPALSTGYGIETVRRGWGRWGSVVYDDLMRATDAAESRPEIDETRTAALGGSFGGYMANWISGHTDRFDAIVTHASLWDLEAFHGTTDLGAWWEREFGDPYSDPSRYRENSPRPHVSEIETPILVIHGELDYRVPISEALTLWTDLQSHGVESKFLYFPDENHWILKPNNSRLWYETVLSFIGHHARGEAWTRPDLL